jgi:ATP-dependent DNA ligase
VSDAHACLSLRLSLLLPVCLFAALRRSLRLCMPLQGWWMSEKLDGVRAWWDGTNFVSRAGNVFSAPDWCVERGRRVWSSLSQLCVTTPAGVVACLSRFTKPLPATPLDGELWCGRGQFQSTVSIVRSGPSDRWKTLQYMVFDAPKDTGVIGCPAVPLCSLPSRWWHGV